MSPEMRGALGLVMCVELARGAAPDLCEWSTTVRIYDGLDKPEDAKAYHAERRQAARRAARSLVRRRR